MKIDLEKFPNVSGKWYASDDEEHFLRNLSMMPIDWHYRFEPVCYNFNASGYRCQEFNNVAWSQSILIFGDSVPMGVGINENETFSSIIEKQINLPVTNLSIGGSSNQLILQNSFSLYRNVRPKAVVLIFTDPSRITLFKKRYAENIGNWIFLKGLAFNDRTKTFYEEWIAEDNADKYGTTVAHLAAMLWTNVGVPVICFQNYGSWTADMGFTRLFDPIDLARDLSHGGIESHRVWAEQIIKELKNAF